MWFRIKYTNMFPVTIKMTWAFLKNHILKKCTMYDQTNLFLVNACSLDYFYFSFTVNYNFKYFFFSLLSSCDKSTHCKYICSNNLATIYDFAIANEPNDFQMSVFEQIYTLCFMCIYIHNQIIFLFNKYKNTYRKAFYNCVKYFVS